MKKSFMTRALAMGLSVAMAFSLSTATNVTMASAAAKPAMKSTSFKVVEGASAKTYKATTKTAKKYTIVKAESLNPKKVEATVKASKKAIKLSAVGTKFGAAKVEITFKNKETGKKTSIKFAGKAVEADKATMTAEATGVKTITVTLSKAPADASAVKATVKKGTADRPCKATVDGKVITLAMDAKLTKGSYTVTVEGVEADALTAALEVEKDETLTSFEISDYIVAKSVTETSTGSIKFAALNQYGEKMSAVDPTVTCSFGTVANSRPSKSATATAEGEITVTGINSILSIVGTTGTVVLVGDMGVTSTKEVSYNNAATATTVEVIGTYHKNSAKLKNISENDTIAGYELLFTAKDQYGYSMSAAQLADLNISLVGGLTNITRNGNALTTRTLDGVDYVAIDLTGALKDAKVQPAVAGDATLMIVNPYKGLLVNTTITVGKSIVVSNITITADNGVYEDQDNEMGYEIVDTEGKVLTSYADITNAVDLTQTTTMRFERKADGTAKLLYNPGDCVAPQQGTDKASMPKVETVYANKQISSDYLVKTFTFTVNQKRYAKGVTGIKDDVITSVAKKGKPLTIKSTDIVLADQYSNKVTDSEGIFNKVLVAGPTGAVTGTSVAFVTNGAVDMAVVGNSIVATPQAVGTATVYLKYAYDAAKPATATPSDYDAKFNVSVYDTNGVDVSTLAIDSVKDGFSVKDSVALTVDDIKVTAMVGGTKTVIPTSQYVIVKNENNSFSTADESAGVTSKTAKVTVQVTTWDSTNTSIETQISKEYEVLDESKVATKAFKVTGKVGDATATGTGIYAAAQFVDQFKFKDQYGVESTGDATITKVDCVNYTIEMITASDKSGYTITSNGTNSAKLEVKTAGTYKFKVTATTPDGSSKDYSITFAAN